MQSARRPTKLRKRSATKRLNEEAIPGFGASYRNAFSGTPGTSTIIFAPVIHFKITAAIPGLFVP